MTRDQQFKTYLSLISAHLADQQRAKATEVASLAKNFFPEHRRRINQVLSPGKFPDNPKGTLGKNQKGLPLTNVWTPGGKSKPIPQDGSDLMATTKPERVEAPIQIAAGDTDTQDEPQELTEEEFLDETDVNGNGNNTTQSKNEYTITQLRQSRAGEIQRIADSMGIEYTTKSETINEIVKKQ